MNEKTKEWIKTQIHESKNILKKLDISYSEVISNKYPIDCGSIDRETANFEAGILYALSEVIKIKED